jgi:tRNA dimethylallyltransferase
LFERDVLTLLPELFLRRNVVIMAGGSGMYIDSVCHGIDDIPDVEQEIRDKYNEMYIESGIEGLRRALRLLDPEHYNKVDLKNHKRIIRALEISESTGRPYSSFLQSRKRERDFRVIKIGLARDRDELYERINLRVDHMLKDGLEEEARKLYIYKNLNALNTVGYREFFDYFDGSISKEKAIELIKRNSRRYAKRQITWWAKDKEINWFHPDQTDEIMRFAEDSISAKVL